MSYDTYWNNAANYDGTGFALMKAREQGDIEARANERRKKRACHDITCNYFYSRRCSQDPLKCEYWLEEEAADLARQKARMLCGDTEDECNIDQCPDEPCHCEYGLELLIERAESRREGDR